MIDVEEWVEFQEEEGERQRLCYVVRFQMGSGLFERLKASDGAVVKLHDRVKAQRIIDWVWQVLATGHHHVDLRQCPVFLALVPEDLVL
jgi:hypothetical protein